MHTQQWLNSPNLIGLPMRRIPLGQVTGLEVYSLPNAIPLPPVTLPRPSTARVQQVAPPTHNPICYRPDNWEQAVFALLGVAALVLILMVFL